ncbi:hypothetical protein GO491_02040 [Flavobacteriaceae bacterium Ap0902]|nr:hypothetical protein [Flavobacteriaceae bacterium Ap0902]
MLQAQIIPNPNAARSIEDMNRSENDSLLSGKNQSRPADSLKIFNPTIGDYNFKLTNGEFRPIDTALTLDAFYRKNEYNKDLFQYQQPPNMGLALNPLTILPESNEPFQLLPVGKSSMYRPVDSIKYYDVKTPLTQFIFENGVQEGQYLSTTFSHNIHSRWNYTLNYNYLSSMGRYLYTDSKNTSFLFNSNYKTKNNRYYIQAAFISHDLNNNENGGLTRQSIQAYIDNDSNFTNRNNMFSNLQDAYTKFDERRIQLQHRFGILSFGRNNNTIQESKEFPIFLHHQLIYKHQDYEYRENTALEYYDTLIVGNVLSNRKKLDHLTNKLTLGYQWSQRLNLQGGIIHQLIKPYYDTEWVYSTGIVPAETKENRIGAVAHLLFQWKDDIQVRGNASFTRGDVFGSAYHIDANINLKPFAGYTLSGGIKAKSNFPSLNYFYNQSFYDRFNYYNQDLDNQTSQELYARLSSDRFGLNLYGKLLNISNYTYLDPTYQVQQSTDALKYFSIGLQEHYKLRKFGGDLRVQYQKALENENLFPTPDIIARGTLYYEDNAFKNNMHFMTGITAHYFSEFNAREFLPVLNEFYLQNEDDTRDIGNYPQIDIFLNMKVRRMRIYLRGENINSFFMPGQNFYTPNQPSRDFKIQLGVHWYLLS